MYDLSESLGGWSAVEPGSSLLIACERPRAGTERVLDILGQGLRDGDGAVVVTTDRPAATVVADLEERATADAHKLAVVDCTGNDGRESTRLESGVFVYRVSSPEDLTGIGIGLTEAFDRLATAGVDRSRVALLSLSSLLDRKDEADVFKFCHVVTSRLDSAGFLGLFTLDAPAVDGRAHQIIAEAFDETVHLRDG